MNVVFVILSTFLCFLPAQSLVNAMTEEVLMLWQKFKEENGKFYHITEDLKRCQIFEKNLNAIARHNQEALKGLHTYTLGLNEHADMSWEEFAQTKLGLVVRNESITIPEMYDFRLNKKRRKMLENNRIKEGNSTRKHEVDYRTTKCVPEIRDQGSCGSCWAFAAVSALETAVCLNTGKLIEFSEQELVDCADKSYGNMGCRGGLMDKAYNYVITNGILPNEQYPYTGLDGKCRLKKRKKPEAQRIRTQVKIEFGNEAMLTEAIRNMGPVTIGIHATPKFQFYKNGMFEDSSCSGDMSQLNHAVVAVGFGTHPKRGDYYILRNSWGKKWGKNGYIFLPRNKNNQCGVASYAVYPII